MSAFPVPFHLRVLVRQGRAGINRTGVAVAVYRMAVQGWSLDDAMDDAKSFGFGVSSEVRFVEQFAKDLTAGEVAGYPWVDE